MFANQFYAVSSNDNYLNEFKNNSSNFSFQLAHKLLLQEYQHKEFNAPSCMTELKDSLKTSISTAVGANNISTEMLKHMPEHCLQTILLLFNEVCFTGELLMCWLHSIIVPLHKPNKPTILPSSYRPISLTSHLCKLMERMVTVRLGWYLESNNLLNQYQSAFRDRRRPLDHLLRLHDAVHKALTNQRSVLVVFLDIEKAYDLVIKISY